MTHPDFDMAGPVALRIAACSHMHEAAPLKGLPAVIVEAMRRRVQSEAERAVEMHNEAFPRRPYQLQRG
jgi:hypothetical protein